MGGEELNPAQRMPLPAEDPTRLLVESLRASHVVDPPATAEDQLIPPPVIAGKETEAAARPADVEAAQVKRLAVEVIQGLGTRAGLYGSRYVQEAIEARARSTPVEDLVEKVMAAMCAIPTHVQKLDVPGVRWYCFRVLPRAEQSEGLEELLALEAAVADLLPRIDATQDLSRLRPKEYANHCVARAKTDPAMARLLKLPYATLSFRLLAIRHFHQVVTSVVQSEAAAVHSPAEAALAELLGALQSPAIISLQRLTEEASAAEAETSPDPDLNAALARLATARMLTPLQDHPNLHLYLKEPTDYLILRGLRVTRLMDNMIRKFASNESDSVHIATLLSALRHRIRSNSQPYERFEADIARQLAAVHPWLTIGENKQVTFTLPEQEEAPKTAVAEAGEHLKEQLAALVQRIFARQTEDGPAILTATQLRTELGTVVDNPEETQAWSALLRQVALHPGLHPLALGGGRQVYLAVPETDPSDFHAQAQRIRDEVVPHIIATLRDYEMSSASFDRCMELARGVQSYLSAAFRPLIIECLKAAGFTQRENDPYFDIDWTRVKL